MNKTTFPIAIICGLLAALLFLAPLSLGVIGMIISSFTAFPLLVSVLGFGTVSGIISGFVSALLVSLFFGPLGGATVLMATLAPALWIGHSIGLSRQEDAHVEWFPLHQVLLRLVIISIIITALVGALSGYNETLAMEQIKAVFTQLNELQNNSGANLETAQKIFLSDAQIHQQALIIASRIPFFMPASLLLLLAINVRLAERFVRRRGWMLRPQDDLPMDTRLPIYSVAIFAICLALSFMPSSIGLVAKVATGGFGAAFVLIGLATIHALTRGMAIRRMLLIFAYMALALTSFLALLYVVLGIAETLFQWRNKRAIDEPLT